MNTTTSSDSFQILCSALDEAALPVHFVGPDGKILWANRKELAMLGYEAQEYIGKPITDFHADQLVINDILHRLTSHETLDEYPARLRCKDGSICHVRITSNVQWEDGRFHHTRCFTRDVTEQVHAERNLLELSVPILVIDSSLLLLPLVGRINQHRAELLTTELLHAVKRQRAKAVVLDLTGAVEVDEYVCQVLINLSRTCKGLGARVVLSGISDSIAQKMVMLGLSVSDIVAAGSLRDGIQEAKKALRV